MQALQLGPLDAIVVPQAPGHPADLTVVLLHGFGAPGTDLVGLAAALQPLPGVRFVFPAAPHPLRDPMMPPGGRAWWDIDMFELHFALTSGRFEALARATPPGLEQAREALDAALEALCKDHGVQPDQLVVGGFSQGAMLACDWALHSSRPLRALVLLSGMLICEEAWVSRMPARAGLPVFQSHSPDDQVLPVLLAERLFELLRQGGLEPEYVSFRGGHGIAAEVVESLRSFLARQVPPSSS